MSSNDETKGDLHLRISEGCTKDGVFAVFARLSLEGECNQIIGLMSKTKADKVLFKPYLDGPLSFIRENIEVDDMAVLLRFLNHAVVLSWHRRPAAAAIAQEELNVDEQAFTVPGAKF